MSELIKTQKLPIQTTQWGTWEELKRSSVLAVVTERFVVSFFNQDDRVVIT